MKIEKAKLALQIASPLMSFQWLKKCQV